MGSSLKIDSIGQPFPALGHNIGISSRNPMPLYQQVYLVLREKLRNGEFADRALPTDEDFCRLYGVSMITIRRAMQTLKFEGLVTRRRGAGTFAADWPTPSPRRGTLDDLLRSVNEIGATTELQKLEHGPVRATLEVAEKLNCKPDSLVYRIDQLRMGGVEPIALISAYLPTWVSAKMHDKSTSPLPVLAQIVRAGIVVERAEQAIGATVADPTAAGHLEAAVGLPLIRLTRLVFDTDMKPVEWLVALYRGDRYEYRTTLTRDGLAGPLRDTISTAVPTAKNKRRRHA